MQEQIEVLTAREAVRRRFEFYVGAPDNSLLPNILLREALCCARDEALQGRCNAVQVSFGQRGEVVILDDGPGLPLAMRADGKREVELYLTQLHACASAKMVAEPNTTCKFGLAVLNFLCEYLDLRIFCEGFEWQQHYCQGAPIDSLRIVGSTTSRGTELRLKLDASILANYQFDVVEFSAWARDYVKELTVTVLDLRAVQMR